MQAHLALNLQHSAAITSSGRPEVKGFLRKDGSAGADLVLHANDVQLLTSHKATAVDTEETQTED